MLDTTTTHGKYWNGSQFSYNLFMFLTIFPFTGMLGVDHLLLRSPITALLKMLSSCIPFFLMFLPPIILVFILPLSLFWYFYDVAQVCGESELIKKYGTGLPYFGPLGIGAGIFTDDKTIKESPKDVQRPWLFIAYALTTLFSIAFPFNKFIVGDYEAGFFYLFLAIIIIGLPIVMAQGIYDIFNLLFDTKTIYEVGFARIPGVSYMFKDYYTFTRLGPVQHCSDNCDPTRLAEATGPAMAPVMAYVGAAKAAAATAGAATAAASLASDLIPKAANTAATAARLVEPLLNKAGQMAKDTAVAAGETAVAAGKAIKETLPPSPYDTTHETVGDILGRKATIAATSGIGATTGAYTTAEAAARAATAAARVSEARSENVLTKLRPPQRGGALTLGSMLPSIPVLLFSVGLLAFSGYVFYIYKNTFKKPEKSDDPPRESSAVREPFKSGQ
jgi:hypothetical protein